MNDLDIDLDRNTPWVDMSACVKVVSIGPAVWPAIRNIDTDRQTDITPFIIWMRVLQATSDHITEPSLLQLASKCILPGSHVPKSIKAETAG